MTTPAEALRALDKTLTPGPWEALKTFGGTTALWSKGDEVSKSEDLVAIATLRTALPALADLVEAADFIATNAGHYDTCSHELEDHNVACDCGYVPIRTALAALTGALDV